MTILCADDERRDADARRHAHRRGPVVVVGRPAEAVVRRRVGLVELAHGADPPQGGEIEPPGPRPGLPPHARLQVADEVPLVEAVRRQFEGTRQADGIHVKRTLSQQEFASLAGTVREVAWRSLKKLEEEGIVRIERTEITLLDLERLAAMA